MRIVFFGASDLGYECCKALCEASYEIVAIFTIPKSFNISYSPDKPVTNVLHRDFFELGKEYNIPVYSVNQNLKEYYDAILGLNPDFLLAIGWYYMIPNRMINLASKGAAGIHASLLPKGRGNAPLVWALINGESQTGISFFYFSDGVDNGEIIGQSVIPIDNEDTIQDLLNKVKSASVKLLLTYIPLIENGSAPRIKQDDSKATYYPKRSPEDGLIDWSKSPEEILRFIRAQTRPYPGAFTIIENKKVIIWDADITTSNHDHM